MNDGSRNAILPVVSMTDGSEPAVMRDGFRMMRMLPWMTIGEKPVMRMSWCVKGNDGSHR